MGKIQRGFGEKVQEKLKELSKPGKIEKFEINNDRKEQANELLVKAGTLMNFNPDSVQYLGSIAVHFLHAPALGQAFYVNQSMLGQVPEVMAAYGLSQLSKELQEHYGVKQQKGRKDYE